MSDATRGKRPDSTAATSPRDLTRMHLWQIQAVRDILLVAVVFFLIWLGYAMSSVTVPLLVGLLLAYLFEPLIARICARWNLKRGVVVGGLVCTIAIVLVLCVAIAVPVIVGQSIQLVNDLRSGRMTRIFLALRENVPDSMRAGYDDTMESISQFLGLRYRPPPIIIGPTSMPETRPDGSVATTQPTTTTDHPNENAVAGGETDLGVSIPPLSEEDIRELVRNEVADQLASHDAASAGSDAMATSPAAPGISSIWNISRASATAILRFLGQVLQIGFLFFLVPFYLFFFSMYYPQIQEFGLNLIPHRNRKTVLPMLAKMDAAVAGFVRGRIVICLIIGVICAIGWTICGVPYAILIGFITGIFCAVPYLGGVGLPIAVILLWVEQLTLPVGVRMSTLWIIGGPTIVYVVMQILETYVITPAIAGKATNLDPVTILVAVLAGGSVGGVYGMLLSIPVAACLKIMLTDVVMPRVREWVKGQSEDPLPL